MYYTPPPQPDLQQLKKRDVIKKIFLPPDRLDEDDIYSRLEIFEPYQKAIENEIKLVTQRIEQCKHIREKSKYLKKAYFYSSKEVPKVEDPRKFIFDPTSPNRTEYISDVQFPTIIRYFPHWNKRATRLHRYLVQQLETRLITVERAILSEFEPLYKDINRRRYLFCQLAFDLDKIYVNHGMNRTSKTLIRYNTADELEKAAKIKKPYVKKCPVHRNNCHCPESGPGFLDRNDTFDVMDDMVGLGSLLVKMCYPPNTHQQTEEYLNEFRAKVNADETIELDVYNCKDIRLMALLAGCSTTKMFGLAYQKNGIKPLKEAYEKLSIVGRNTATAVARIFVISTENMFREAAGIQELKLVTRLEPEELNFLIHSL